MEDKHPCDGSVEGIEEEPLQSIGVVILHRGRVDKDGEEKGTNGQKSDEATTLRCDWSGGRLGWNTVICIICRRLCHRGFLVVITRVQPCRWFAGRGRCATISISPKRRRHDELDDNDMNNAAAVNSTTQALTFFVDFLRDICNTHVACVSVLGCTRYKYKYF